MIPSKLGVICERLCPEANRSRHPPAQILPPGKLAGSAVTPVSRKGEYRSSRLRAYNYIRWKNLIDQSGKAMPEENKPEFSFEQQRRNQA